MAKVIAVMPIALREYSAGASSGKSCPLSYGRSLHGTAGVAPMGPWPVRGRRHRFVMLPGVAVRGRGARARTGGSMRAGVVSHGWCAGRGDD